MAADPERLDGAPRVAIISDEGPQTGTAGGLLLHRLFARQPPDRLRVLCRYVPALGNPLPGVAYRRLVPPWRRFEASRFNVWMRSLRAFGLVPPVPMREFDRLLEGFSPDVVLCVMQHSAFYDAAHRFARMRGLPLVVVVHDVNEEFEAVFRWARGAMRRRDGAFYRYASGRLCVSPEMERLCAELYRADGSVLYPNRSEGLEARPLAECSRLKSPPGLTLGFAGNLNYGYGEGILQMLPAVRQAGARVVIFAHPPSGPAARLAEAADCCEFRGFAPSAEAWAGLKRDCDAVWLPYPRIGGKMERLYRHHFPSKLPEYLALGMPVIVTGPDFATGVRWARANLGPELCATEAREMAGLLGRMAQDPARRLSLAERCVNCGQRDFDPAKIVAQFHAHLAEAARRAG